VRVTRGVKDLGTNAGATGSHIIECEDGERYAVKFAGRSKAAINEFVGQILAKEAGLPVPDSALVHLSGELVATSADMRYRSIAPGLHPGTVLVPNAFDLDRWQELSSRTAASLENPDALPGSICHDNWILTVDRDRADNHLVQAADGRFRYFMLDFTHGFAGPLWTADSLEQAGYLRILVPVHPLVASSVAGQASFERTLARIESISDSRIEEAVHSIPPAWGISDEEIECLVDFLELRRGLLRGVLTSNLSSFSDSVL